MHTSRFLRISATALAVCGLVVTGAVTATAAPAEYQESHQFQPTDGARAGYSSDLSGDYAAYTNAYGSSVDFAHHVGPGPDDWEVATVAVPDTASRFGAAVRFNEDATRAYVSAPRDSAIHVFARTGTNTWAADGTLAPTGLPDRVTTLTQSLGEALDVAGNTLVVGVPNAVVDGIDNTGFFYTVDVTTNTWTPHIPQTVLFRSITGQSVAIEGTHVAVSAVQNKVGGFRVGGLYLWDLATPDAQPLVTSQPEADEKVCLATNGGGPAFGMSLAFASGMLYVGSPIEINYTEDLPTSITGGCNQASVDAGGTTQGAIYQFDMGLTQLGGKIIPPAGTTGFGNTIAADGNVLLADGSHAPDYEGEVAVFDVTHLETTGTGDENSRQRPAPVQTLVASDAQPDDQFGTQIYGTGMSVSGDRAMISSPFARDGAGAVYIFEPLLPNVSTDVSVGELSRVYGQAADVTATVTGGDTSGTVTFTLNGSTLAPVAVTGGVATASLAAASHPVGTYDVSASYSVDGTAEAAVGMGRLTIVQATTDTTASLNSDRVAVGDTVTVSGTVSAQFGTVPTGSVAILRGGVAVGEATLDATGAYTYDLVADVAGEFSVGARYAGDHNHAASAAAAVTAEVGGPGVVVEPSPEPSTPAPTARAEDGLAVTGTDGGAAPLWAAALGVLAGAVLLVSRVRRQSVRIGEAVRRE